MGLGVAAIARVAGVSAHTVRFYAKRGLLRPRRNPRNGYREFASQDQRAMSFIRRAQLLGFTLGEIATILERARRRESPCPVVRDIVRRRVDEFDTRLRELAEMRQRMNRALVRWRRMPDRVPTGEEICHLIESVAE